MKRNKARNHEVTTKVSKIETDKIRNEAKRKNITISELVRNKIIK